jgi:hypothetical protein
VHKLKSLQLDSHLHQLFVVFGFVSRGGKINNIVALLLFIRCAVTCIINSV